jgi:hypothetical protein
MEGRVESTDNVLTHSIEPGCYGILVPALYPVLVAIIVSLLGLCAWFFVCLQLIFVTVYFFRLELRTKCQHEVTVGMLNSASPFSVMALQQWPRGVSQPTDHIQHYSGSSTSASARWLPLAY